MEIEPYTEVNLTADRKVVAELRGVSKNFDDVLLLDSTSANHQSFIAATNKSLHKKLLGYYDTRIGQWETLLKQRHEAR